MSKKTTIEGYTVSVFVPVRDKAGWVRSFSFRGARSPDAAHADAREIREAIVRHLSHDHDDVCQNTVEIDAQISETCESCGAPWTEDGGAYNGGCCNEDEAEREEERSENGQFGVGA